MSEHPGNLVLSKTRFRDGLWEGVLSGHTGDDAPNLTAAWAGRNLTIEVQTGPDGRGNWLVRVTVPREAIGDGLQSFCIRDSEGVELHRFELLAGDALEGDLRAEVSALRAEVDMLAAAFRSMSRKIDRTD